MVLQRGGAGGIDALFLVITPPLAHPSAMAPLSGTAVQ
jgi:hypothetical protein